MRPARGIPVAASLLALLIPLSLTLSLTTAGCGDAEANLTDADRELTLPDAAQTRVEVARIEPSTAALSIRIPAEVTGARDALLASPAGGFVEKVHVQEGQAVNAGQAIVAIDRQSSTARKAQADAQLAQAQAELQRAEKMGDLASAQQLQQAQTQVQLAQAQADLAGIAWRRSLITAPFAGVITQLDLEEGEVAPPMSPVARLVQIDRVEVSMSVADRDVVAIQPGMPVMVQTDATARSFPGTVSSVSPTSDLSTRAFLVKATVDNPDHLLMPGMIARVSLESRVAEGTVVIPQEWLVTRAEGIGVFVVEEGLARWRAIVPGALVGDQVVVDSGLQAGDTVVSTGHRALADGDALLIARTGVCCTDGRATY